MRNSEGSKKYGIERENCADKECFKVKENSNVSHKKIKAILFDLDGTLLDTAPDLAHALNLLLSKNGRATLPLEKIRPVASDGVKGLLALGFNISDTSPDFSQLRTDFLEYYTTHISRETTLFPGMDTVLNELETRGIPWGIVTNKIACLTEPLLKNLNLHHQAGCIVSGDTLEFAKPHPAPLLHACELLGRTAEECVYVGDAKRDIEAGLRANMSTIVALYGYIKETDDPYSWQANATIKSPEELIDCLEEFNRFV